VTFATEDGAEYEIGDILGAGEFKSKILAFPDNIRNPSWTFFLLLRLGYS
jgi:hypothetical protein